MIKYIVSDLNGVIIHPVDGQNQKTLSQIFSLSDKQANEIWDAHKDLLVLGKESSWHFLEKVRRLVHSQKSLALLLKEWRDLYSHMSTNIDRDLLDFYDELKHHYTMYMLTDTQEIHSQEDKKKGAYEPFTAVFTSNNEHSKKPNEEAFYNFLRKTGVSAEDCLFIDDIDENVQAAEKVGMKSIIYHDLPQLKKELQKLNIIS